MFEMKFKTGNAAFCNVFTGEPSDMFERAEVVRLLRKAADEIESGYSHRKVVDLNGNSVGEYRLK